MVNESKSKEGKEEPIESMGLYRNRCYRYYCRRLVNLRMKSKLMQVKQFEHKKQSCIALIRDKRRRKRNKKKIRPAELKRITKFR